MLVDSILATASLSERTEVGFLYRVLESGDLGLSAEEFDRLLVEHDAYQDACNRCTERLIDGHAAVLRDKMSLGKNALLKGEIVEGRTPRSFLPGQYIEALGRLGLTERLLETVAFDGPQALLITEHSAGQEASQGC